MKKTLLKIHPIYWKYDDSHPPDIFGSFNDLDEEIDYQEQLEKIPIMKIEKFLRKKKLESIQGEK